MTNLCGSDTCAVTVSGEQTDAGFNYTATAASLSNSNYVLPALNVTQSFDIARASLTEKAKDNAITYGDAPSGNGIECTGLVGSDTADSLGTPAYAFNYNRYDNVSANPTTYTITPSGLSSDNYLITYQDGALTMNPREVTLVWSTPNSFDYTGSAITWPALSGAVNGDDVSIGTYTGGAVTDAGAHTAEVVDLVGGKAGNYKLPANAAHDWTVVGAANGAAVEMGDWIYGDEPAEPQVTATVHVTGVAKPAADGADTGSTERPATTRAASKAASPATGDAPLALTAGLLLASAIVAAAALMLARRQTRRRGRHAR